MDIKKIMIIGSGLMGRGIAQVSAVGGFTVYLRDLNEELLKKATADIQKSLEKFSEKGKLAEPVADIMKRIIPVTELTMAQECDFVMEVVPEVFEIKEQVFKELDQLCGPEVIIATNTSAIPITKLACTTNRRDKVVGTHFFNPVPMMNMVEIIKGAETSDETVEITKQYVEAIGKKSCIVTRDIAGFVMNRIGICAALEAIHLLETGIATAEDIDRGMRLAWGWSMGPLETFDLTGLDSAMHAAMSIYEETKDTKFLPPVMMQRLVAAGHLGRKTGKGFYDYTKK